MRRVSVPAPFFVLLAACSGNGGADGKAMVAEAAVSAAQSPDAGAISTEATLASLDPSSVTPYFIEGRAAAGAAAYALEKWSEARKEFAAALKAEKDSAQKSRLRLVLAMCEAELGSHAAAAKLFGEVATELPLLADFANYRAAESAYVVKDRKLARAHADKVAKESIYADEVTLLLGDLLRDGGEWKAAGDLYDAYLGNEPSLYRLAEARYRRAEVYEKLGKPALEVGLLYKEVTTLGVLTSWGSRAEERTQALAKKVSGDDRAKLLDLSADERIHRGETYYDNHRNELSEAEFAAALTATGLNAENACVAAFNRANSVFKQRDRDRAAPLFEEAIALCDKSKNDDLQVKSNYQAGRSYGLTARSETAIARYGVIEAKHATHSYADDARLRAAEEYRDINNQKKVTELLSSIPTKYPKGDMRAEAMWRLAWRSFSDKDYDDAIKWLKKQIEVKPIDENYWAEGQAQYWLGRAYAEKGDGKSALTWYTEAVKVYPLSYYALLAFNRIREADEKAYAVLVKAIAAEPEGFDPKTPAFTFKPRAVYGTDAFRAAIELLRLGLGREAQEQLSALGFVVPEGKSEVTDEDEIDRIWATALLNHQAGRYSRSHWVTRWHVLDFKRSWPVGHNRDRWRIAYPVAWWELLSKHADLHGYPPELLISFVREESSFNPLQESFANAIGLTQMIFPTAKRFAKGTDIEVSRDTLRDPEKNVTIGARFLNFLFGRYGKRVSLTVPAYNAGEGAVDRWLRYRGDWAMDSWAEEIPYDETRNYSKRVIATFFAYNYLKDGTIPVMPNDIPEAAVKQAKR